VIFAFTLTGTMAEYAAGTSSDETVLDVINPFGGWSGEPLISLKTQFMSPSWTKLMKIKLSIKMATKSAFGLVSPVLQEKKNPSTPQYSCSSVQFKRPSSPPAPSLSPSFSDEPKITVSFKNFASLTHSFFFFSILLKF